jgi:long-chain acyl-CoA synthetase
VTPISFWAHAAKNPDALAVVDPDGTEHSAGDLLASANQIVHALRALGLVRGDTLACVLENSVVPLELFMAAAQAGWFLTPINTHLAPPEIAYIVQDSGAKAVFISPRTAAVAVPAIETVPENARFSTGPVAGFRDYASWKAGFPTTLPDDRSAGGPMTYTSGTTGRPKGVRRASYQVPPEAVSTPQAMFLGLFGILPGSVGVHLTVAPLYHTAVLNFATNHLHLGHTVVVMDRWTAEGTLSLIERYRVTCSHMVPTQLIRLLKLPEEVKLSFDVSSLRNMIHSAAPCPVPVKQAMLDWWGPVLYEYYAASEGGGTLATPQEWLAKPGTVGKPWPISQIRVLDDAGQPVPAGTPGTVWIRMGDHKFEYHGDPEKTDQAWSEGFFTVGDAGYLDSDGYLFLCDRKADMIISGGVNIYPAEIECVLVQHPKVADVAVFGVPDEEWGESVKAVIEAAEGVSPGAELGQELLLFCQGQLARYKQPRTVDFIETMPRDPNGKLYKRRLRDPYWVGHDRSI